MYEGRFYASVPLVTGTNVLNTVATTAEGLSVSDSITVTSNGVSPFDVSAEPAGGIAPLSTNFVLTNNNVNPLQKIEIDFDGNGSIDYISIDPDAPIPFTYGAPGIYQARITVTDSQNQVSTQVVLVSVLDGTKMDQLIAALWGGMNGALVSGDTVKAGGFLNDAAQRKYLPVFQTLLPQMPQIIASYSPLRRISITGEIGEYAISRPIGGKNMLFLVYFLKDVDGVWRLDSM